MEVDVETPRDVGHVLQGRRAVEEGVEAVAASHTEFGGRGPPQNENQGARPPPKSKVRGRYLREEVGRRAERGGKGGWRSAEHMGSAPPKTRKLRRHWVEGRGG